ncbi:heme ABC transporter permease [archaeon SCG-AAA382B04]|nr:heme ABC transporter permease [archaeon SCG-AAA382B04]
MNEYLKKVQSIVWKDIIIELRMKEMLNTMLIFSILVILISSFAFGTFNQEMTQSIAPGVLWIAFTFAGMLGLGRSFISEKDRGCLQGMMLAPTDWSAIYIGKTIANLIFMSIMEILTLIVFVVLFNFGQIITSPLKFVLITIVGTFGFVSVGTLLSAVSVNTKTREMLLPVLLFPVIVPIIIGAVEATLSIITANGQFWGWVRILVAYDIIFFTVSALSFNYVIEG